MLTTANSLNLRVQSDVDVGGRTRPKAGGKRTHPPGAARWGRETPPRPPARRLRAVALPPPQPAPLPERAGMPAEELSRLIDRELGHQRRPPGAARPEPEARPDQRASSTSWVARHLAAAMEHASGREAPLPHPRSLRSSVVVGWVLVGCFGRSDALSM